MPWMRRYACTLTRGSLVDSDDLVQQAVLKALERHEQFSGANMDGWLVAILRNLWLNQCQRKEIAGRLGECQRNVDDLADSPSASLAANESEDARLLSLELRRHLGCLPAETQDAILLIYGFGWTYSEVADRLGWTVRTVRSHVTKARTTLRACLAQEDLSRLGNGRNR